jgi:EAL and modified HD-GYP domain-containing signal transduction protein
MAGNRRGISESAQTSPPSQSGVRLVRQPLFNGDEELVGHRLLSRGDGSGQPGGYLAAMPQGADGELVLAEELHALAPRGLILLSVSRSELLEQRALSLPPERVVLCLRGAEPLDEDLRDAIDRHAMRGFRLALDAVTLATVDGPLLERADMVIVEVGAFSPDQLAGLVTSARQRPRPLELVAGGVDSRRAFRVCRQLGFDLFQGQFVLRPTVGPARTVAEAGLGGIGTMADLAGTDNFERLSAIITRDPGLSMRLLRYANSAHMALPRRVGSVHEALAWLGTVAVREFALIAALANVPEAPAEMVVTALTRARMCQQLSRSLPATAPEESFTVGLFSVAEAVANAPIEVLVREMPLREDIVAALIGGDGELGRLLSAVIAYERGDFASAATLTGAPELIAETYLESIRWADSAVNAVA